VEGLGKAARILNGCGRARLPPTPPPPAKWWSSRRPLDPGSRWTTSVC